MESDDDDDHEDDDNDDGDHEDDDHDDYKKNGSNTCSCKRKIVHISGGYAHREIYYIKALKKSSGLLREKCQEILDLDFTYIGRKTKPFTAKLERSNIREFKFGEGPISTFNFETFGDSKVFISFVNNEGENPCFELKFVNSKGFSWDKGINCCLEHCSDGVVIVKHEDGWTFKYSEIVAIKLMEHAEKEKVEHFEKHGYMYEHQDEIVCDSYYLNDMIHATLEIMFRDFKNILESVVRENKKSPAPLLTSSLGSKA